jgi:hypothetical protein
MKKYLFAAFILLQIFTISISAQKRTKPVLLKYAQLEDYVSGEKARAGQTIIVREVPLLKKIFRADAMGNKNLKGLIYLQTGEDNHAGNTFVSSQVLIKALRPNLKSGTSTLRVTCTLVEFAGDSDVYSSLFATKVEGLNELGKVVWTASGTPPSRLEFHQ